MVLLCCKMGAKDILLSHRLVIPLWVGLALCSPLAAQTLSSSSPPASAGQAGLVAVIALCSVLVGLMVFALFPNREARGQYHRQRRFGRADGISFSLTGHRLLEPDRREFLRQHQMGRLPQKPTNRGEVVQLVLRSITHGGCSVSCPEKALRKGDILFLDLHTLPGFPSPEHTVPARVVWSRVQYVESKEIVTHGTKFLPESHGNTPEPIRAWIHDLLEGNPLAS